LHGLLWSLNNEIAWPLRKPLHAHCSHGPALEYVPRRNGPIVPQGFYVEVTPIAPNFAVQERNYLFKAPPNSQMKTANLPCCQLPDGWGYAIEQVERDTPDEACTCGIYALRSKEALLESSYYLNNEAVGSVALWGKIIPGEDGFRAQYAYPIAIYTDKNLSDYGVPVRPKSELYGG
jgi:hypothetical protein